MNSATSSEGLCLVTTHCGILFVCFFNFTEPSKHGFWFCFFTGLLCGATSCATESTCISCAFPLAPFFFRFLFSYSNLLLFYLISFSFIIIPYTPVCFLMRGRKGVDWMGRRIGRNWSRGRGNHNQDIEYGKIYTTVSQSGVKGHPERRDKRTVGP